MGWHYGSNGVFQTGPHLFEGVSVFAKFEVEVLSEAPGRFELEYETENLPADGSYYFEVAVDGISIIQESNKRDKFNKDLEKGNHTIAISFTRKEQSTQSLANALIHKLLIEGFSVRTSNKYSSTSINSC